MSAGQSPFKRWHSELAKCGFERQGTGGRKGAYLVRQAGTLEQGIGVLVADHREGAFNIQLNINMPLRCAEPPHRVVILEGDLGVDAVRIREPWVHDPALNTWWPANNIDEAWTALQNLGLDWLERNSDLHALANYLESECERYQHTPRSSVSWLTRLARRLVLTEPRPKPAHFQYLLWLSMIYEEMGDLPTARERLAAYCAEIGARGILSEADRLERHRRALDRAG